jgi:hypothetical protein
MTIRSGTPVLTIQDWIALAEEYERQGNRKRAAFCREQARKLAGKEKKS